MTGFEYPAQPHTRRHGPMGYQDYESYRDWLRDEFTFRCVYCLHREQWYGRGTTFHLDHFIPVAVDPDGTCEYSNLLYACAACNEAKRDILSIPDPCKVGFHDCLRIMADGRVEALNRDGEKLEKALLLNSETNVGFRSRWMRNLETLRVANPTLYKEYMGFPANLPDLRKKRVPQNTKPEGAANCYLALRERGLLPAIY
jgi:HNH endonuclease